MAATLSPRTAAGVPIRYSLSQAADVLGVSRWTLRRMIARGELAATRIGSRLVRIDADALAAVGTKIGGTK